jgi:hypothetical protein
MADKTTKPGGTLGTRPSASRKLLTHKAAEKAANTEQAGEVLEDMFPAGEGAESGPTDERAGPLEADIPNDQASTQEPNLPVIPMPVNAPTALQPVAGPTAPAAPSAWSDEDERAFQGLAARRKAAGYIRRGRDVGGQLIALGNIKPNPDTVVAIIVGLVAAAGGNMQRIALIDAMVTVTFPHPKAQPTDRGWCQGYIAGAVRNGFLAMVAEPIVAQAA